MKGTVVIAFFVCWSCLGADEPVFRKLPESPAKLIESLKTTNTVYTILTSELNYVKESDIPHLAKLLDSKEPCAHVEQSISSFMPTNQSTVGHEAAYLIEGFWKRYYPTQLSSSRFTPDIEDMKQWFASWSHRKKLAERDALTKDALPRR